MHQTGIGFGVPALLLGAGFVFPVAIAASLVTGLVLPGGGLSSSLARKFTNQSDSTYGAMMMGPVTPPAASSVP